jgi:hypothetical protein
MTKLADILTGTDSHTISLTKLTGHAIKDIEGYLANDFGSVNFKLTHVVMDDGSKIDIEGEHDFPYLVSDEMNLGEETLTRLDEEGERNAV